MAAKIYDSQGEIQVDAPKANASAPVPVWDPDQSSLRSVDAATAKQLAAEGYATGAEAQGEAIRQSATYKLAGFAAKAGEAGSAGLSNLANLALGNREGLQEEKRFDAEHPYISGAGSFLGYGASYGLGAGQLGAGLAGKLGTTAAKSALAHVVLPGAIAGGTEGAIDEFTRESLMRDPVHLDQIAASAFTSVLWNSLANTIGYGIGKAPGFLRNKVGDWAEWAEKSGWHVPQLKKSAVQPTGPHMSRATISGERSFEDTVASQELNRTESIDDIKERLQTQEFSQATIKRATNAVEEGSSKTATTTKTGKSVSGKGDVADVAHPPESADVAEIKPVFSWPAGYNKDAKIAVLRRMTKFRLGDDATHLSMWNEVSKAEDEIGKWQRQRTLAEKAIASGKEPEFSPETCNEQIKKLIREKEDYKNYLSEAVPREKRGDKFVPGFRDLNEEYARAVGNLRNDLVEPEFGAAIPKAQGQGKGPTVRTTEAQTENKVDTSKFKRVASDATTTVDKDGIKTDTSTRDFDKEVAQTQTNTKNTERGKDKYQVVFTFPKTPPKMDRVGIKQPFSSVDIASTLGAGALVPGAMPVAKAVAGYKAARNTLAYLASNREPIGNFVGNAGDKLLKYGTPTLKATIAAIGSRGVHNPYAGVGAIDVAAYQRAADVLNAAAANPQVVQSHVETAYPQMAAQHPEAAAQVATTIARAARMLNDTVPKRPYAPTLRDTQFRPPRAQQVRMLSRWQIIANPQMALRTGDPQTLQLLQEIYPSWYKQEVTRLLQDTQAYKGPILGQAARNITAFTGAAVNPANNAAAQKRLQATAGPVPENNSGQQGPSAARIGGGPQSTKTANAAANRDDPSFELN